MNETSKAAPIKVGIAQGSSLGQLLSLAYINDHPKAVWKKTSMKTLMFIDDAAFYKTDGSFQKLENNIGQALLCLSQWANKWKMHLNPQKPKQFSPKTAKMNTFFVTP